MIMVGQANSATNGTNSLNTNSSKKLATKICCFLFGNQDASDDIVKQVERARNHFAISKDDRLPVKFINNCPWLQNFLSFTWFGSWFNKEEWGLLNDNEKSFAIYHEVAHEKLNHPIKQIGGMFGGIGVGGLFVYNFPKLLKNSFPELSKNKFFNFGLKTTFALFALLVVTVNQAWYARTCEQEADIHAAQKLCELGKKDLVQQHVDNLNTNNDDTTNILSVFPSKKEQQAYLQLILNQS